MPRRAALLAVLATAASLTAAATPAGAEVRIGSNLLSQPDSAGACSGVDCTATNLALPSSKQAFQGLVSPVNGTVTAWLYRAAGSAAAQISLRVLHPNGGLSFTGAGTSSSVPVVGGVQGQFGTALSIGIGDAIGVNANGAQIVADAVAGATQGSWTLPPLADGSTRNATVGADAETMVQAIIQPTNTVRFGGIRRNKRKGTASVLVAVPNAGVLAYSGVGVVATGPARVGAPGEIQVRVKSAGKKRSRLRRRGSAWVSPQVSFAPAQGDAGTTFGKLKLIRKTRSPA
jgi:hypothetical protein